MDAELAAAVDVLVGRTGNPRYRVLAAEPHYRDELVAAAARPWPPENPAGGESRRRVGAAIPPPILVRIEHCPRRVLLAPAREGCRCQDARCLLHDRIMSTADCISCQARQIEQETIDRTGAG